MYCQGFTECVIIHFMNNNALIDVSLADCLLIIFFIILSKRPSVTFIYLNYLKVKGLPESICTFKLYLYLHGNNLNRAIQFMVKKMAQ